jgi:glycine cleavage system H protein
MPTLPEHLRYATSHEWACLEQDNLVRVGITDFAQSELGDIVFIDLPQVGRHVVCKEQLATVESVKTASDLFSPVTGTITAINTALSDSPELVNDDAFGTWLFCIQADNPAELEALMDASAYQSMIDQ